MAKLASVLQAASSSTITCSGFTHADDAAVSRPRHSVNRSSLRQGAVLKKIRGREALPAFWELCSHGLCGTRSRTADAADAADAHAKEMFRSVCCCLPGRKPDYLQASETSHLLGASPSTEQPTAADRDLAQRYWAKAVDCHSRGDLDSAVAQFTRAAKLDPSRADVLLHLGTALQDRGDLDDAADCYRRVLSLDPTNHGALYNLGYVYEEQRQFDDAIRCFDDALRVAPHDADAAINVGNCYMQMDDVARAIRTYEKVVERDDTCAIGHYNLGSACHARRDLDKAARHFSRTISLEPGYADAHFNLGIVHQERGRLEEALRCYDEAARLDSTLADAAAAADFVRRALKEDAKRKGANKEP